MAKYESSNNTSGRANPFLRYSLFLVLLFSGYQLIRFLWVKILIWILRLQSGLAASEASSIGIIDGADGPTAVFVTTSEETYMWIPVLLIIAGILTIWSLRNKKKTS